MMEREKAVDLKEFGIEQPVIVKRLSAGEKRDLNNALTKANSISMKGNEVYGDLMPGDTELIAAKAYYKSGPFKVEELVGLDWEIVAIIAAEGDELNSPFAGRKANSESNESGSL